MRDIQIKSDACILAAWFFECSNAIGNRFHTRKRRSAACERMEYQEGCNRRKAMEHLQFWWINDSSQCASRKTSGKDPFQQR